jgi:glyoxylase-like metal-dependent hydrolase (beta-lactamase superfamily II)
MSHGEADEGRALFDIQKVTDGVYSAVAVPAYRVNSNAAIVENDDGLLVVDSHSKPSAARVLVETLRELTPKPVRYLVNTHFHWDHWQGNEAYPAAYPGVEVITNDITREAMVRKSLKRIQDHLRSGPAELAQLRAELAAAQSADARARIQSNIRQAEAYLAEVRALKPALPTMAFENTMRLFRGDREIHLLYLGRAHTEGDVFVYLPREKVVITGDCVIGWTPYMGDGYPEDWGRTLGRLEQLDFTTMIMGHGEPAGKDWLRRFRSYLEDLVAAVRREAAAGASLDEVKQRVSAELAPKHEATFAKYAAYRPWRQLVLANIERTFGQVS